MNDRILIVIPTYNEAKNIEPLIESIDRVGKGAFGILFVDDASPDGTGRLIENIIRRRPNTFALHRSGKLGLGTAYLDGFRYAVTKDYDYIFEMDADLSHDPSYILLMLKKFDSNDVVVGSRFLGTMQNINSTPFRIFVSLMAGRYLKVFLGLKCLDVMAGFVGYKKRVLENLDLSCFFSRGYSFQAEIKYKCQVKKFKISEIPIIFRTRTLGDSKIKKRDMLEAFLLPWRLKFCKW